MGVFDLFSRRKRLAEKAGQPDVYTYDDIPEGLRVQIIHIWSEAIAGYPGQGGRGRLLWDDLERVIAKEHRLFNLGDGRNSFERWQQYFMSTAFEKAADMIELSFRVIDRAVRDNEFVARGHGVTVMAQEAIEELNQRLREEGVGYQYVDGVLIRVDSQYIHAEVVKKALSLLASNPIFDGPEQEFLKAHEHYRHGRIQEAIVEALKAFESTMKAICAARRWTHSPTAAAKDLIKTIFDNELVPRYLETYFSGLRQMLEAGLPTVRNKTSGHGQGPTPIDVPPYMAAYALHMAAANIVMLVEAHKAKK